MSRMQKFAWFNLAIVVLAVLVVVSLVPILGWQRAHGGMGLLGLAAFGPLFFRKKQDKVVTDERDRLIQLRAQIAANSLFFLVFVIVSVWISAKVYGESGTVPVMVVQMSVWWAWILMQGVTSIATLAQYAGGSGNAD